MTDRRYYDTASSSSTSKSSTTSNSSSTTAGSSSSSNCSSNRIAIFTGISNNRGNFRSANRSIVCKPPLSRTVTTARCNSNNNRIRPAISTVMHVRKTWKNAVVMVLAVAAVTTATAAFYFNYTATEASTCCGLIAAAQQQQQQQQQLPTGSPELTVSAAAAVSADAQPNRSLFSSSVLHASKVYAVCRTYGYYGGGIIDRDKSYGWRRFRRQLNVREVTDSTDGGGGSSDRNPANGGDGRASITDYAVGSGGEADEVALIYFITPTYPRREQVAELTRLGQTLMHVPRLHWIVADDRPDCSQQTMNLLPDFGIPYTYIASPMPAIYKRATDAIPRGVSNRRAAINWIRLNHNIDDTKAVIYFGDDDNTFHLDLFKEIRTTKKISMFPVGLVGEYAISSPIVEKGKVVGFFDSWPAKRKFPVDMAGFAINVQLLFKYPYATMPYKAGFEEDRFLSALSIQLEDIEPKAENCTRILVWHTQTAKKPKPTVMVRSKAALPGSLATLLDQVTLLGVGGVSETTGVRSYITKNGNIFRV